MIRFAAGALTPEAFARAEVHLDGCSFCRLGVSVLAARTGGDVRGGALSAFAAGDLVAGRYEVIALLGSGGMGEVYEVLDTVLGETVALKTIAVSAALDSDHVARLKAEVQSARRVTHRNVCRVFDVGFHAVDNGVNDEGARTSIPFFTMEVLRGETLRGRLRRLGPRPVDEILFLLEEIATGLDAAHAANIIHRDLKSENLMLVPDGSGQRVVITDFGLALQIGASSRRPTAGAPQGGPPGKTTSHHVAGTFGYMAPEQFAGRPTSAATDIYALGVVLFELLTGQLPFAPEEVMGSSGDALREPPPTVSSLVSVPAGWDDAIRRCLHVTPEARFQRAGALLSVLRSAARPRAAGRARWAATPRRLVVAAAGLVVLTGAAVATRSRRDARAVARPTLVAKTAALPASPPQGRLSQAPADVGGAREPAALTSPSAAKGGDRLAVLADGQPRASGGGGATRPRRVTGGSRISSGHSSAAPRTLRGASPLRSRESAAAKDEGAAANEEDELIDPFVRSR